MTTLGKVYSGTEEKEEKKVFIPHKSDGFPKSKIPHNYVVKWTDGSTAVFQYVTGAELRVLAEGRKPVKYERI